VNEFITCKIPSYRDRPNHHIKLAHIDDIRPDALEVEGKPPCYYAVFYHDRKQVYFWCFEHKEDRDEAMKEVRAQLSIATYTVPAGKVALVSIPKKRGKK
jgi:methionine synthase II (cobalamin-independent)